MKGQQDKKQTSSIQYSPISMAEYNNVFKWVRGAYIHNSNNTSVLYKDYFEADVDRLIDVLQTKDSIKLGDVIDRLPHGIIDKRATGIGATHLELMTQCRSSIIVVPTKSLAYNKYKSMLALHGDGYALYVGSPIAEINTNLTPQSTKAFLDINPDKPKKFLVVADSLWWLIKCLEDNGVDVYNQYFLLVDEIDTMQSDSSYRPRLEMAMDYYFKFKKENRAVVSATLNNFSNPLMSREPKTLIISDTPSKRKIELVYANYAEATAVERIDKLLKEKSEDKILVAYNSLEGIFNILEQLDIDRANCGILCSERSFDKVKDYLEDTDKVIDENGYLQKRLVFMTCAYFAGIDINDSCHLITITSYRKPFTYLSTGRMTQIAGRCRKGNISETIIYDIPQDSSISDFETLEAYKDDLFKKSSAYAKFLNEAISTAKADPSLEPLVEHLLSFVEYKAKSQANDKKYPLKIIRTNIHNTIEPAYFVIDALLEDWLLGHQLYIHSDNLRDELEKEHDVVFDIDLRAKDEVDNTHLLKIKEIQERNNSKKLEQIKKELLQWNAGVRDNKELQTIMQKCDKKLQDLVKWFVTLSLYIDPQRLLEDLTSVYSNKKSLRNYINAASFYALPAGHPFKVLVLNKFSYHSTQVGSRERGMGIITPEQKTKYLMQVFEECYHAKFSEAIVANLFACFFEWTRTGKNYKITGLNPLDLPPLIKEMPQQQNVLDVFILD